MSRKKKASPEPNQLTHTEAPAQPTSWPIADLPEPRDGDSRERVVRSLYAWKELAVQLVNSAAAGYVSTSAVSDFNQFTRSFVEWCGKHVSHLVIGTTSLSELALQLFKLAHWDSYPPARRPARKPTQADLEESRDLAFIALENITQYVCRMVDEKTPRTLQALAPKDSEPAIMPASPSVDDEDIRILYALQKQAPRLCTLYDIETDASVSRKTVGQRLNNLIDAGLAQRPRGPNQGATIIAKGAELLKKFPAQK